ncbi:hypothetical protein [Deinococcus irradiatisoli]|uniref:hypothetical protein n=1 Tax=Deinococcus irradiatisoli TaxID=2202254 RepID=UPI0011B2126B|nr:hypothetical protein [Deinococcus irradiatisoli]
MSLLDRMLVLSLPLLAAGYLGGVAGRLTPQPLLVSPPAIEHCFQPPKFEVSYQGGQNYLVMRNETYRFQSTSWLQADICQAGTLNVTAYGEVAGGEAPRLVVALNDKVLGTQSFDQERTWKLSIPTAGRLILGYLNDFYLADVRVATLSHFRVAGPICEAVPQINVPAASGGRWNPTANVATLLHPPALKVIPCGPGKLTFSLLGREGNSIFPQLSIMQEGKVLSQPFSAAQPEIINLNVSAAPLSITVLNPYGKTLADRNLIVTQLSFLPYRR